MKILKYVVVSSFFLEAMHSQANENGMYFLEQSRKKQGKVRN